MKRRDNRKGNMNWGGIQQLMHLSSEPDIMIAPLAFATSRTQRQLNRFFFLNAAWLNEGRCPGGRPSAKTKWRIANSMEFGFLESNKHKTKKRKKQPQSSLPESAGGGTCSLFLGRLDQRGRRCLFHGLEDAWNSLITAITWQFATSVLSRLNLVKSSFEQMFLWAK